MSLSVKGKYMINTKDIYFVNWIS